jgi:peroxiredoxin
MGELGEFVKHDADFKKLDVQILAISVDPPKKGQWVEEKLKVPFPILSDSKREVMEHYGTRSSEYHNREGGSINTPSGAVVFKHIGGLDTALPCENLPGSPTIPRGEQREYMVHLWST